MARSGLAAISFAIALLVVSGEVRASVIFDNGAPDLTASPNALFSDADLTNLNPTYDFGVQVADDFMLSDGRSTITDIHWWGTYAFADTPTASSDSFTIQIFSDDGGKPAASPIISLNVGDVGRTDTGDDVPNFEGGTFDLYAYQVVVAPITLDPDTVFWLSIFNDTAGDADDGWGWQFSGTGSGNEHVRLFGGTTTDVAWDPDTDFHGATAFSLTSVPEPASLTIFAFGLAGLGSAFRRRKSR